MAEAAANIMSIGRYAISITLPLIHERFRPVTDFYRNNASGALSDYICYTFMSFKGFGKIKQLRLFVKVKKSALCKNIKPGHWRDTPISLRAYFVIRNT